MSQRVVLIFIKAHLLRWTFHRFGFTFFAITNPSSCQTYRLLYTCFHPVERSQMDIEVCFLGIRPLTAFEKACIGSNALLELDVLREVIYVLAASTL